jgi:hypothetical protein
MLMDSVGKEFKKGKWGCLFVFHDASTMFGVSTGRLKGWWLMAENYIFLTASWTWLQLILLSGTSAVVLNHNTYTWPFCMTWVSSQHSSLKLVGLLGWRHKEPKASVSRKPGRSCIALPCMIWSWKLFFHFCHSCDPEKIKRAHKLCFSKVIL